MDQEVEKSATRSQWIGLTMVFFGTAAIFTGCHFHYAELTTSAAGITGAGINMLTNQIRSSASKSASSTITGDVITPPA